MAILGNLFPKYVTVNIKLIKEFDGVPDLSGKTGLQSAERRHSNWFAARKLSQMCSLLN